MELELGEILGRKVDLNTVSRFCGNHSPRTLHVSTTYSPAEPLVILEDIASLDPPAMM
jgi:hypothetical protein